MNRRRVCVLLLALVACGCGSRAQQGKITGMVKIDGVPLSSGTVEFVDEKGNTVAGPISREGLYQVAGVTAGPVRIAVISHPRGLNPFHAPGAPGDRGRASPERALPIPAHYSDPTQSRLGYEVLKGEQKYDIELTAAK